MTSTSKYREDWKLRHVGSTLFLGGTLMLSIIMGQALIVLAAPVLLALYHWAIAPAVKFRHIAGPPFRPLVGNLPELFKNEYHEAVYQWSLQYGPVYRFFMGPTPIVVLADPELSKNVGLTLFHDFHDRTAMQSIETAPDGLVFSKGAYWAGARSAVMPLFHTEQLEAYAPAMHGALSKMRARMTEAAAKGEPVEVKQLTQQLSFDIIGKAAFGVDFEAQTDAETGPLVVAANKLINTIKIGSGAPLETVVGLFFPRAVQDCIAGLMKLVPGTMERVGFENRKFLMDVAERTAAERRARGGEDDVMRSSDFLTYLARTARVKDTGRKLTDREIRAIAMEVLLAGSDTTATTIAMAVFFLSYHADARNKVYKEIDRNAKAGVKEPGYSDLAKYSYVEQVVKETLRMFSTGPLLIRTAKRDMHVAGTHIPAGTIVWLATETVHRNPVHFPDPEQFRPERFDPHNPEALQRHPYAYLPFGLGPRMCVGFKFAMEEAQIALITLYQSFRFEPRPDTPTWPLKVWAGIVLKPSENILLDVYLR